jgi:alginate O-acetyltransferase complex protein AlgI
VLFNSLEYLYFYSVVLTLFWLLLGFPKLRIWVLLLASYYFYASNNHWYIFLIIISTQVDYFASIMIEKTNSLRQKKYLVVLSLTINLGILAFYKYFNFFASTVADLSGAAGIQMSWVDLNIILPVGISFYTFQSMSYTIDVYRKRIQAERSWYRFAFFVSFFPQLIAGPIVRGRDFLPQTYHKPKLNQAALEEALFRIFRGLFKKIVLSGFLAIYADRAFDSPGDISSLTAWVGVYAFSLQIYFDFSGYTDLAIGCARLMGFHLPENFRRPYSAISITDFWRRWHISLSSWLKDYLYISLGGNRMKTKLGVYRNLMLTMILGGLWHGAAWNFILWGFLHGLFLSLEKAFGLAGNNVVGFFQRAIRGLLIFNLTCLLWMVFRAEDTKTLLILWNKLVLFENTEAVTIGMILVFLLLVSTWFWQLLAEFQNLEQFFHRLPIPVKGGVYASIWVLIMIFNSGESQPFIYFRF